MASSQTDAQPIWPIRTPSQELSRLTHHLDIGFCPQVLLNVSDIDPVTDRHNHYDIVVYVC